MATFSDEILTAFVDGELDPAQAVEVQLALIADPVLAQRIERFRNVRKALRLTYDAVVKEPVPDHLLALLNQVDQAANAGRAVIEAAPGAQKPPARASMWAVLAVSVIAGVLIGRVIASRTQADED